jgi:hypothetical protein
MRAEHQPQGGFRKAPRFLKWGPAERAWFAARRRYRDLRVHRIATRALGPQYTRSRNRIEIDITYRCNLGCLNCNRSIARAPENLDIPVSAIEGFVEQSLRRGVRWHRIRVLGGEPTLHPQFIEIVSVLRSYRQSWVPCSIEVVTNGNGKHVNAVLAELPKDIWLENSRKVPGWQPKFRPFSDAPIDDEHYACASFVNGCEIMSVCGMGLTPLGYYPCALAGGIDRIVGGGWGRSALPGKSDDMLDIANKSCRLCGRFKDGHYIPQNLYELLTEEVISPTWQRLYDEWKQRNGR